MEGWEAKSAPLLPSPGDESVDEWREFEPLEEHAGLTEEQAADLLDTSEEMRPTLGERIAVNLLTPMPAFLIGVTLLCFAIRDWVTGLVVSSLTALHVAMTLHEEMQMEGSAAVLKEFLTAPAMVKRSGEWRSVSSREVVRGDLIRLKMGEVVPADAVLQNGEVLEVDQSVVTGESFPVLRDVRETVISGSVVLTGHMTAVALRPAKKSMFGRSAQLVGAAKSRTRLQYLLLQIAGVVSVIALIVASILVIVKLSIGHSPAIFVLQTALGMLVAAVPISMTVVVTSAFALTSRELGDMGMLVSRFASIEQLAGMQVSLLDKTGTLSQNKLELAEPWLLGTSSELELREAAALGASAELPDAIDRAVLSAVEPEHLSIKYRVQSREGFTPVKKHSSAIVVPLDPVNAPAFEVKKGTPEALLAFCRDPDGSLRKKVLTAVSEFAGRGLRALAVAKKTSGEGDWVFLGMLTFRDALKPDAPALIRGLQYLGVEVKMLTGDGQDIARETSRLVGLPTDMVLSRKDLLAMLSVGSLELRSVNAFTQVYPEDKLNVVAVLQRGDCIVGMTGDGINDCPAMRQADIGIAVHGASPACMVAADMIMMHDKLSAIKEAVLTCRLSVERLRNYLLFRINCTFVILFWSFFGALTITYGFPALAFVCIAWTNNLAIFSIICDNSLVPLAPTKWRGRDIVPISIVFCILSCLELYLFFALAQAGHFLFTPGLEVEQLRSVVFLGMILLQQWSVLVVRSRGLILGQEASRPGWLLLLFLVLSSFSATLLVAFWPFGSGLAPIGWNDIAQVYIVAAIGLLVTDMAKVGFEYFAREFWADEADNQDPNAPPVNRDEPSFLDPTKEEPEEDEPDDELNERPLMSMMDRMFDVLFIVMFSHLGLNIFQQRSGWSYADFFGHWVPIYMTWSLLESFINRFARRVSWIPFLYLLVSLTFGGLGLNFYGCHMNVTEALSECHGYAVFLSASRLVISVTWCMAAIANKVGRSFAIWKTVCALVPSSLYWLSTFLAVETRVSMLLPIFWFVGIALDVFLSFVSSSFVWMDRESKRYARYAEERHGMLLVIALAEVVISTVLPRSVGARAFWYGNRYSDVILVLIMVFVLAMYHFVVSETLRQLTTHAIHRAWWHKCVWMVCQFVSITGAVVIGLIAKLLSSGKMFMFDRLSFGISTSVIIFASALGQQMHESSPQELRRRITSRAFRLIVRTCCGSCLLLYSLLPISILSDTNWLILCVATALVFLIVEWCGRIRAKKWNKRKLR